MSKSDNTFALERSEPISWNEILGEENTFPVLYWSVNEYSVDKKLLKLFLVLLVCKTDGLLPTRRGAYHTWLRKSANDNSIKTWL